MESFTKITKKVQSNLTLHKPNQSTKTKIKTSGFNFCLLLLSLKVKNIIRMFYKTILDFDIPTYTTLIIDLIKVYILLN